jgi:hypothetical protein
MRRRIEMGKSKSAKKAAAKAKKPVKPAVTAAPKDEPKEKARENLCVFAFRLKPEERDAIHKAAGPAKASKFVRALAVAAARNDETAVRAIMKEVQSEA